MQRPRAPAPSRRITVIACLSLLLVTYALVGCVIPLSPADLERDENHFYPGRSKAQLYKATLTALQTTGFQVVVNDQGGGKLKTAPKVITATAYGNSYGAVATENAIAWSIDVMPAAGGAALRAEPRAYSGGQLIPPSSVNGDYLERLFGTLYGAVDENLPGGTPPPPPPPR